MIETCNPEPKSIDISTESFPVSLGRSFLLMCTPHFPLAIPASIPLTFPTFPTQAKQFVPLRNCTSYLTLMHHFCPGAWTLCFMVTQTTLGRTYAWYMVPELKPNSTRRFYIFLFSIGEKKSKPRITWKRGKIYQDFPTSYPTPERNLTDKWKAACFMEILPTSEVFSLLGPQCLPPLMPIMLPFLVS